MTVASLWKALDRAGCGQPIGLEELRDPANYYHHHQQQKSKSNVNPWNINGIKKRSAARSETTASQTLAVDLSIWICESFASSAISNNHSDPTLHLVYSRTVRLLKLGIKLIVVIEGKRRTKGVHGELFTCQKRRTGTRFWSACQRCEQMLRLLGVPVVRAKAEGEALCALLNRRGIVDGVISNDGDCFLFGAKVMYTKFSLENLDKKRVMRYDANHIKACVDDVDGDNEYDTTMAKVKNGRQSQQQNESSDIVNLTRNDLIAFAILTGSDLAGSGFSQVGCRKAIRFVKKCQIDNPLKRESAAIDELRSWAKAASSKDDIVDSSTEEEQRQALPAEGEKQKQRFCSCCGHHGNKRDHLKNGCKGCGTEPGESCYKDSSGRKFRQSLRGKALLMLPKFDPEAVIYLYQHPNDNQIPMNFVGKDARSINMGAPKVQELLKSSFIVRGHYVGESRLYLKQSLGGLLAKYELLSNDINQQHHVGNEGAVTTKRLPRNRNRPIPKMITKRVTRAGIACFVIQWQVNATTTDSKGKPIDEFEFSTIEEQRVISKRYPELVTDYEEEEKERKKQGNAEQEKRKAFLDSMCPQDNGGAINDKDKNKKTGQRKRRGGFVANTKSVIEKVLPNSKKRRSTTDSKPANNNEINSANFGNEQQNGEYSADLGTRGENFLPHQQHSQAQNASFSAVDRFNGNGIDNAQSTCSHTLVVARYAHKSSELCGMIGIAPPHAKGADAADDDDFDYSTIVSYGTANSMSPTTGQPSNEEESTILTPGHLHFLQREGQTNHQRSFGQDNKVLQQSDDPIPERIFFGRSFTFNDDEDHDLERGQVSEQQHCQADRRGKRVSFGRLVTFNNEDNDIDRYQGIEDFHSSGENWQPDRSRSHRELQSPDPKRRRHSIALPSDRMSRMYPRGVVQQSAIEERQHEDLMRNEEPTLRDDPPLSFEAGRNCEEFHMQHHPNHAGTYQRSEELQREDLKRYEEPTLRKELPLNFEDGRNYRDIGTEYHSDHVGPPYKTFKERRPDDSRRNKDPLLREKLPLNFKEDRGYRDVDIEYHPNHAAAPYQPFEERQQDDLMRNEEPTLREELSVNFKEERGYQDVGAEYAPTDYFNVDNNVDSMLYGNGYENGGMKDEWRKSQKSSQWEMYNNCCIDRSYYKPDYRYGQQQVRPQKLEMVSERAGVEYPDDYIESTGIDSTLMDCSDVDTFEAMRKSDRMDFTPLDTKCESDAMRMNFLDPSSHGFDQLELSGTNPAIPSGYYPTSMDPKSYNTSGSYDEIYHPEENFTGDMNGYHHQEVVNGTPSFVRESRGNTRDKNDKFISTEESVFDSELNPYTNHEAYRTDCRKREKKTQYGETPDMNGTLTLEEEFGLGNDFDPTVVYPPDYYPPSRKQEKKANSGGIFSKEGRRRQRKPKVDYDACMEAVEKELRERIKWESQGFVDSVNFDEF